MPSRWSRARPRPATRTLAAADDDDFADLIEGSFNLYKRGLKFEE